MQLSKRAFLRAAIVSPVIVGAWLIWDRGRRPKADSRPAVCCLPGGVRGRACIHPPAESHQRKGDA